MGNPYVLDNSKGGKYYYDNIENTYGFDLRMDNIGMFCDAKAFNQPLDKWNVSNVVDMWYIFCNAKQFNQNLDSWSVDSSRCNGVSAFKGSAMENNPPKWCKK